jgi:uncharacterized Ntn-hydrolase superfamily protein
MRITRVINGGAIWSGEAFSGRQHYSWLADQDGKGCQAQSGRLKENRDTFRAMASGICDFTSRFVERQPR